MWILVIHIHGMQYTHSVRMHEGMHVHVCTCTCTYVHVCIIVFMYMYAFIYVCMYVCMYVHMYVLYVYHIRIIEHDWGE